MFVFASSKFLVDCQITIANIFVSHSPTDNTQKSIRKPLSSALNLCYVCTVRSKLDQFFCKESCDIVKSSAILPETIKPLKSLRVTSQLANGTRERIVIHVD